MARIFIAMNGKRINTLDDLRENFNAKQIFGFYKSKRLHSWLEEQNYADILADINSFDPEMDDDTLLSMLMAVFELDNEAIARVKAEIAEEFAQKEKKAAEEKMIQEVIELPPEMPDPVSSENCFVDSMGIRWRSYTLLKEDLSNSISARSVVWKEKNFTLKNLKIEDLFFADGYFWCRALTGEKKKNVWIPVLLKSADCKNWDVLPCTQICDAIECFQKDDISIFSVREGGGLLDFSGRGESLYISGSHILHNSKVKFWSDCNSGFYNDGLWCYFSRPGELWHKIEDIKTSVGSSRPDAMAFLGDFYLAFVFYSMGNSELFWAKADFYWQKCNMAKDCITMSAGNGIVVLVDKKQRNYYVGEFLK